LLLIASFTSLNLAQAQAVTEEDIAEAYRSNYSNSTSLPDGVAFVATLRMLKAIALENPEFAVNLVESEMGLATDSAKLLTDSLLVALEQFDAVESEAVRKAACDHGIPKATGREAFELLDSVDDAREAAAERYLLAFETTLTGDAKSRFRQWLDYRKLNTTHVTYGHKKMAALHGRFNLDGEIAALCNMVEQEHAARNRSK